jgi:hypothetical protein
MKRGDEITKRDDDVMKRLVANGFPISQCPFSLSTMRLTAT